MKDKIKELEKNNSKLYNFIMCFLASIGFFLCFLPFIETITLIGLYYASISLIGMGIISFVILYFV